MHHYKLVLTTQSCICYDIYLDIVCTVQFLYFIIFVQWMHNIFVNNYLFLIALLHVFMFTHHPQGVSYYVR